MGDDPRGRLLRAALGFLALEPREPELQLLHRCFDNWRGIGDVVTGMKRQGYQVSLGDHGAGQWIAVFYAGHGGQQPVPSNYSPIGSVLIAGRPRRHRLFHAQ